MNWTKFLQIVYGTGEGWAWLGYKQHDRWRQRAYEYPGQLPAMVAYAKQLNESGADVYFVPHLLSSAERRLAGYALPSNVLWIDLDGPEPDLIDPRPTICWVTSEDHHQALWVLEEAGAPDEIAQANRYLAYRWGGDKGSWNLSQPIRFPASVNYKHGDPYQGWVLWDDGPVHKLEELAPRTEIALKEKGEQAAQLPPSLPSVSEVLLRTGQRIPRKAWNLLQMDPTDGDDWSETLWQLERLLVEAGLDAEEVFVLVRQSPWNKYARDRRPETHLWEEVQKAVAHGRSGIADDADDHSDAALPWVGMDTLLVHSERPQWLVEGFWMDKNCGWIAGVGKSYKSVVSIDLALSVASGKPFLGKFKVHKPGPVLMVQEEDPLWRVARRVQMIAEAKGITKTKMTEEKDGLLLEVPSALEVPIRMSVGGGFLFSVEEKTAALEEALDQYRPRMLILDPWFMLAAGYDDWKAGEVAPILAQLKHWRDVYGCAVIVVHHYRKGTGDYTERLYGSQVLYSWSENSLFVNRHRNTNTIVIERDIKDAPPETGKLAIDIEDLDQEYNITVREDAEVAELPGMSASEQRVAAALLANGGRVMSMKELATAADLSERRLRDVLASLEKMGKAVTKTEGQGGRKWVQASAALLQEEHSFDLIT